MTTAAGKSHGSAGAGPAPPGTEAVPALILAPAFTGASGFTALGAFEEVVTAVTPEDAWLALAALEGAGRRGLAGVAALSFEFGYLLEPRLEPLLPARRTEPLVRVGLFREESLAPAPLAAGGAAPPALAPMVGDDSFAAAIADVLGLIAAGDAYQVNLTRPLRGRFEGRAGDLFAALLAHQRSPYAAFIDWGDEAVLSLSPELFFERRQDFIRVRPMKGTARRAPTLAADQNAAAALASDAKNRAENLMIVDLMRNDLSRIARPGTVRVSELFTLETYRTLHTLTSTVEAALTPATHLTDILRAIFPCGSVTGAPKIRAIEIIRSLEPFPRGLYTGAVGFVRANGDAVFNVAIRTLVVRGGEARLGVGGGIVIDSRADDEIEETRIKARFLTDLSPYTEDQRPLTLIETMRAEGGGILRLERHLSRLSDSARYFGFQLDAAALREDLLARAAALKPGGPARLRLELAQDGNFQITSAPLGPPAAHWRLTIARERISASDPYRAHKTSRRAIYDRAVAALAQSEGADEPLFLNERGELAEGARTNLFLRRGGRLLTPPVESGALPGVLRAELLATGEAAEAILLPGDLAGGDEIFVGNSLRGLIRGLMVP